MWLINTLRVEGYHILKSIHIITNPREIRTFSTFIHRQILQLLDEQAMTETQLSKELGITKAAIGYHLNQLLETNLIYLHNVEPEKHGILQKFYRPIAHIILPQYNRIPAKLNRRFIQIQIDHLIGVLAVLQLQNQLTRISTDTLAKLADAMLKQLESTCTQYLEKNAIEPENLKVKIYADALASLANLDEWHTILKFTN